MIAEVLNRSFVLQQMERVKRVLADQASGGRRDAVEVPYELDRADYATALEEIQGADASGQPGFEAPATAVADRRGEGAAPPPPLDERSFIGRDPALSNLQSAIEEFVRTRSAKDIKPATPAGDRRGGGAPDPVTGERLSDDRRLGEQFSVTDVRWVSSLFAMGIRRFRDRHPWNDKPATPLAIGDNARVLLVGDWGSGVERAQKIGKEMRKVLDEGKAAGREQHVVHLGDVYYSGWDYEYTRRFLPFWPVRPDEAGAIGSWNLNGNHDMYAGGHAFYNTSLGDPRFARQEKSSFFSLHNANWQILGLDTAYEDHGLHGSQAEWAKGILTAPENAGKKGLFLSHHQIFSSYEKKKPNEPDPPLLTKIRPVLATGRVKSWFWGHEHRCVLYKPFENVEYARCIGHGGVPVYMTHKEDDPYPEPGDYEYRAFIKHGVEKWALFGFTVLELNGPEVAVRYIDENGKEHKNERIV